MDLIQKQVLQGPSVNNQTNNSPKKEQKIINKTNVRRNWQKVRNALKGLQKDKYISNNKPTNNQNIKKLGLICKNQYKLQQKQRQQLIYWIQKNNTNMDPSLLYNSQLLRTSNKIILHPSSYPTSKQPSQIKCQYLDIVTYRPLPKINYLARQHIGTGCIDTTGIWVWQAEQILAYYLSIFWDKHNCNHVLEIGAGCSGLAAMVYSKLWHLHNADKINQKLHTTITDGRSDNIILLHTNIHTNFKQPTENKQVIIRATQYIWGQNQPLIKETGQLPQYGLILAADCVFFQQYHQNLIACIGQLLVDGGVGLFVNPQRGTSFTNFISKLNQHNFSQKQYMLQHRCIEFQDKTYKDLTYKIKQNENYDKERDQYIFTQVRKIGRQKIPP